MKIGPVTINFAEKKAPVKPDYDERGATGTVFFSGYLSEEEYNSDLQGSKGRTVYEKMRKSDGQVKASLRACKLPLRAAEWTIEPASEDKQDMEIAEFIEDNLFNGMTNTFDSFLSHALIMLDFGWMAFEPCYELVDGMVRWRKIAPRLPKTLSKWLLDETGGLAGIEQQVWKNDTYQYITIPAEKLIVFTNDKEGSNFEGESILRTAYKHWYYKDNLYRIDAISAERHALGVPVFTHPADADAATKSTIDSLGQRLYAHEQGYLRLADGYSFKIEGLSGTIKDILPSIKEHDRQIGVSILADFLALSGSERGSYSLAKDQSSFFLMALNSVATNICETFNRYEIQRLVSYNWPNVKVYPKLKCGNLFTRDMNAYATAVSQLVTAGALTNNLETENSLRALLKLPELKEPEEEKPAEAPDKQSEHKHVWQGIEFIRELTEAEKSVDFSEIEKKLDISEQAIVEAAKATQKKQIDKLVDLALKIIEKKQVDKLEDIDIPFRAEMASAISDVLMELYSYGRKQVRQELNLQKKSAKLADYEPYGMEPLDPAQKALIEKYLITRAKADVNLLANKLRTTVTFEALNQIRQGVIDREALSAALNELSDAELKKAAQYAVSEAFNFGRSAEAERLKKEIETCQYSALMDGGTCETCSAMDGKEWDFDDPRTIKYARGNPDCLGKTRCRCVLVYISKTERRNP